MDLCVCVCVCTQELNAVGKADKLKGFELLKGIHLDAK